MSQTLSLVEQLKHLEQLQELDLKIDSIKKNQSSLPLSLKIIDESLNKLKAEMEVKKAQIAEIEKIRRQAHAALDINKDRLDRAGVKLEAVHKANEFQAANKEIEQLKKLGTSLEEQNKKSQDESHAAQEELKKITDKIEALNTERTAKAETVSGEEHRFQTDLGVLVSDRGQFTSGIDKRILTQYDRVRTARGGLGIVPASGGRCKGCNMVVPPQLYNEVQRGTILHACPSCHRILYVPASAGDTSGTAAS